MVSPVNACHSYMVCLVPSVLGVETCFAHVRVRWSAPVCGGPGKGGLLQ